MTRSINLLAVACFLLAGCRKRTEPNTVADTSVAPTAIVAPQNPFPNAHKLPPPGWKGPVFELSQDYPTALPAPENYPWTSIDFKTEPEQYIRAVLAYAFEGNINVDWVVQKNKKRIWYHAPWMHWGPRGREFIRGLTRERDSRPGELATTQTSTFMNWAVGMYNPPGGYVLGQVWSDHSNPNAGKSVFPEGTVSVKLLFTTATANEVPFLANSFEWQANILPTVDSKKRTPLPVRLLQIDVAVRDRRNDDNTGWVFGTFVYQKDSPGKTPWERMEPVGLMWGNDPGVTPSEVAGGTKLSQQWLNPKVKLQHYGWAGRLDGPVDSPTSSCLSCHSTGEIPSKSGMTFGGASTDTQRLRWFRNIKAGQPFDPGAVSTDYSLQISRGILNLLASQKPDAMALLGSHAFAEVSVDTLEMLDALADKPLVIDGQVFQPVTRDVE